MKVDNVKLRVPLIDKKKKKNLIVGWGFHQQEGINFSEIFSLVMKATTFRSVLSIASLHYCHIHQLGINNVFLKGFLDEDVLMS